MWKHGNSNRAYRLIWNARREAFVPAPETTKSRKGSSATTTTLREPVQDAVEPHAPLLPLALNLALALSGAALSLDAGAVDSGALPANATVTAGNVNFSTQGSQLTVNQQTDRAIIDWQSFDIGQDAAVRFVQPDVSSVALNRVVGGTASEILGRLDANGQVYLVNPSGVLFGKSAQVNVGGLVASAMQIADEDFLAGRDRFTLDGATGSVVNEGSITATDGGRIVLLGANVSNSGTLAAAGGNVALAAGRQVTFAAGANGHLKFAVDATEVATLVENGGVIRADGGQIVLTAQGANALAAAVVSNTGTLQARTIAEKEGRILLLADLHEGGTANVAGTLDASAPVTGDGGFIETSGATVRVADGTSITTKAQAGNTGTWLVDPTDFTISAGSGAQTPSGIGADTLSANLQNTSVTLATDDSSGTDAGDIHVNAAVSWSADTTLTLNAYNNININAAITATGTNAGLALNYGNYASAGSATSGTDYIVNAPITLAGSNANLGINGNAYTLIRSMADLLAINTDLGGHHALAQDLDAGGTTYTRSLIGHAGMFRGTFAGLGHTLSNLTISTNGIRNTGLFGTAGIGALIRDIGLLGGSVNGDSQENVGSLVAYNEGIVSRSYATTDVFGGGFAGGLVGINSLVGIVSQSHATGSVSGSYASGGLIGINEGSVSQSYATGAVSGQNNAGGLAGNNWGTVSHSYATGSVNGAMVAGGLAGASNGIVSHSYATGPVSGSPTVGGLIGRLFSGTVSDSRWDSASTGRANAIGQILGSPSVINVTALDGSSRYSHASYGSLGSWSETASGSGVWVAADGGGQPQWVMIEGATRPFLYSEWSSNITNIHQLQLMALQVDASYTLARDIDAGAASGSNASGMWSTNGFSPIGNLSATFVGSLQGNGHIIDGLRIDRPLTDHVGLFGYVNAGAALRDLGLTGVSIQGNTRVGAVAGSNNRGVLSNVHATGGSVGGSFNVGGLVGQSDRGVISNAHAGVTVAGIDNIGGLVGSSSSSVSQSYATGAVVANSVGGGLIGVNLSGTVTQSYATGAVGGGEYLGGLVAYNRGVITQSYATGTVNGTQVLGGLVGYAYNDSRITQSYATGLVTGSNDVGGLMGNNEGGRVNDSFWLSSNTSIGFGVSSGSVGRTRGLSAAEATNLNTYIAAGWDIDDQGGTGSAWRIYDGSTMPLLRNFLTAITVSPDALPGKVYDGQVLSGSSGYDTDVPGAVLEGVATYVTASANAGTYSAADGNLRFTGLYSGQQGYDISYDVSGTVTITPRAITANITADDKIYDGTTAATTSGALGSGVIGGDDVTLATSGSFNDPNAGVGKTVSVSGSLSGADANNYVLTTNTAVLADIVPKSLVVTVNDVARIYDGQAWTGGNGVSYDGFIGGEDASVLGGQLTWGGSAQGARDAGNYSLGASGLSSTNYAISYQDGALTIDPRAITVTAISGRSTYGDSGLVDPGLTATGLADGEDVSVLTGLANSLGIDNTTNAGSHVLTVTGTLANGNYIVMERHDGSWTVDPARLVVTANDAHKVPDGTVFQGGNGVSYQGFVNGEDASTLEGELVYGGSSQGAISPGRYAISASGLVASNYDIEYRDGSLIIGAPRSVPSAGEFERITRDSIDRPFALPGQWNNAGLPLRVTADYINIEP